MSLKVNDNVILSFFLLILLGAFISGGCGNARDFETANVDNSTQASPMPSKLSSGSSICEAVHYNSLTENPRCYKLQELLIESAIKGDIDGMKRALSEGANVEGGYYQSYAPLYGAAMQGQVDAVRLLLDNNANIDRMENFGQTPLKVAVFYNRKEVVKLLIDRGVNVCLSEANDFGENLTALDVAKKNKLSEMQDFLTNAGGSNCESEKEIQ